MSPGPGRAPDGREAEPSTVTAPDAGAAALPASAWLAGLTIFAAAAALRPPILVLGPLASRMIGDLGISHGVMGLLGAASVLFIGLASPFGPALTGRLGVRTAMAAVLAALLALGLARAVAPGYAPILLLTLAIGALIGLGQSQPPVFARRTSLAPQLASLAMTLGLVGSSVAGAVVAVPLAVATGDWRWALAIVTLPTAGSLLLWLLVVPRSRSGDRPAGAARLPWRDHEAWWLAACFGLQAVLYTSLVTWLPEAVAERGWDEASGAGLVGLLNVMALLSNVVLLLVGTRLARTSRAVVAVSVTALLAALGLALGLEPALAVTLMGLSLGAILPLLVTLGLRRAYDAPRAGALTALMFTVGYCVAGAGPLLVGAARDATGSFELALWMLVFDGVALLLVALRVQLAGDDAGGRPSGLERARDERGVRRAGRIQLDDA